MSAPAKAERVVRPRDLEAVERANASLRKCLAESIRTAATLKADNAVLRARLAALEVTP